MKLSINKMSITTKFNLITTLSIVLSLMSFFAAVELSKMTAMQKIERDHMAYALALRAKTAQYIKAIQTDQIAQASEIYSKISSNFKEMGISQLIKIIYSQPAKIYEITIGAERWMFSVLGFESAFKLADKGLKDSKAFMKLAKKINDAPNIKDSLKTNKAELLLSINNIEDNGIKFAPIVSDASKFVTTMMSSMIALAVVMLLSFLYLAKLNILNNIKMFQTGLLDFFDFLSGKRDKSSPIQIDTEDEVNEMAQIINEQISQAQKRFGEDYKFIQDTQNVMSRVANGWFLEHITQTTQSKSLNQLKHTINNALKILEKRFDTINSVFESYAKYDYTHKLTLENVEKNGRGKTRTLDGILVQIALEQLREAFPNRYVAVKQAEKARNLS